MKNFTKKAVFLDRDGVLNEEIGDYITRFENFKLLPHIYEGLAWLKQQGYLLFVITNQGGIAKGLYSHNDLAEMHAFMHAELAKHQLKLDEIKK